MKRKVSALLTAVMVLSLAPAAMAAEPETVRAEYFREGRLYVEGIYVGIWDEAGYERTPIMYQGTVYVPLWTAGLWLGAKTVWDREKQQVQITTGQSGPSYLTYGDGQAFKVQNSPEMLEQFRYDCAHGMDAGLLRDAVILVDGAVWTMTNALGQEVYPLVFDDGLYLPVRSVGALADKQVLWLPDPEGPGTIYLYAAVTPEQMAEGSAYCDNAVETLARFDAEVERLAQIEPLTEENFHAQLEVLKSIIDELINAPQPSASVFSPAVSAVRHSAQEMWDYDFHGYYYAQEGALIPQVYEQGCTVWRENLLQFYRKDNRREATQNALEQLRHECASITSAQS